jgi:fido (protein-threonine AMPylation protein)
MPIANREGKHLVHLVLKTAPLHFWLAYLHPFCDGNGRTARVLSYWFSLNCRHVNYQPTVSQLMIDSSSC